MHMTSLKVLSLCDNQLTGPVPPTIGLLTELHDLWLSHNALSGVGCIALLACALLEILKLSCSYVVYAHQ